MQSSKGFREKGMVFKASIFEFHHLLGFGFYCKPPQSALELLSSPIAILSSQMPAMNSPQGKLCQALHMQTTERTICKRKDEPCVVVPI